MDINKLYCGDNLEIMRDMPDDSIDLIYTDPPFFTQKNWGDFDDRFDSMDHYIGFISERISEMQRILKSTGSMYLHCDAHASHYIKVVMDGIFGIKNFHNEIIWKRIPVNNAAINKYSEICDHILFYTKSNNYTFHKQYIKTIDKTIYKTEIETGRLFSTSGMTLLGNSPKELIFIDKGLIQAPKGRRFRWCQKTYDERIKENPYVIYWNKNGIPRKKHYQDEYKGSLVTTLWTDITRIKGSYSTQKPEKLLERIINTSSNMDDLILDPFNGGGTTVAVAKKLGRKWIGIDQNPDAIKLTEERLAKIVDQNRLYKWI